MLNNIDVGIDNFRTIRTSGNCYVDKTCFLEEFISSRPKHVTLFTRPRRFGKSLTLSLMDEFFNCQKESTDIFKDLKISGNTELCRNWMNKFPVIHLKFKDISGDRFELAYNQLKTELRDVLVKHAYLLSNNDIDETYRNDLHAVKNMHANDTQIINSIFILTLSLNIHYGVRPIILIDEYDNPLIKAYQYGYHKQMSDIIRLMFSKALKSNDYLKFAVLTGCMRISSESLFTGINNLKYYDVTSQKFADAFGFTETEVRSLLENYGLSQKLDEVRDWYDGYNFGDSNEIYNPWSILNYIDDHINNNNASPKTYWMNTSANEFAYELLGKNTELLSLDIDNLLKQKYIYKLIDNQLTYLDISRNEDSTFWSIMHACGYLTTISDAKDKNYASNNSNESELYEDKIALKIPNNEVYIIWRKKVLVYFENAVNKYSFEKFNEGFWNADSEVVENELVKFMTGSLSSFDVGEYIYHTMLLTILSGFYKAKSNRECGLGRYDIAVRGDDEMSKRAAIVEIKRVNDPKQLEHYAQLALKQIADKKYDYDLRQEGYKTILHWGMAFHGKNCRAIVRPVSNVRAYRRLPTGVQ